MDIHLADGSPAARFRVGEHSRRLLDRAAVLRRVGPPCMSENIVFIVAEIRPAPEIEPIWIG